MWHDVEQTDEARCVCCDRQWLDLRVGKVTGTSLSKIMAWADKDRFGDPAKAFAVEIAVVELGGRQTEYNYINDDMRRGTEQEPIARALYEQETFTVVTKGGFFDNGRTGCSPDGLCDDGLIEIKSVLNHVHYASFARKCYDPAYKWQVLFNLKESGRNWIDFVSFCSTFPAEKRLCVYRVFRKDVQKEFDLIDRRLDAFFKLVETIKAELKRG